MKAKVPLSVLAVVALLLIACAAAATPTSTPVPSRATPRPAATPALVPPTATPTKTPPETAGPKIQEIKNRGMLIISVKKEESPTGQHRDVAHFQKRDFEISLAKAIAKTLLGDENKVEVKMYPLADRVPAVERNEVDLAISAISISEELKKIVNFSDPYAWEGLTLMARKGAGITGLEGLKGQTVAATTEGGRYFGNDIERIAQERGLAITAKSYGDFEEAASAVETGQARAVIHRSIDILVYMAQKPGVFETVGGTLSREEYGIAIKKGNDDLLRLVNSVISELKKSGEIKQLAERAKFPAQHIALP
ncbi:MAG: amino acid ABC transporter substrate-binding protein [Chloroflexi bacterium]|nr:amino acid ABC transporter substrate-binding protein [Chloroflexota bacterium]